MNSVERREIVESHFNQLSAENIMKPAYIHPQESTYFWDDSDELIAYAQANGMSMHGHVLIWHSQVASWMENFTGDATAWNNMMVSHIDTIASRYAGDLASWDVVNEAFTDGPGSTYRPTIWYNNIGAEYLANAFIAARAADANADLYYNDYSISGDAAKFAQVLALVDDFQENDVPIDGIGFQMHINLNWPAISTIESHFQQIVDRGLKVKVTELDIEIGTTTPDAGDYELQRDRYQAVVAAYVNTVPTELRGGITVWGILDSDSWKGTTHPLLFYGSATPELEFSPKPAFYGFAEGLSE